MRTPTLLIMAIFLTTSSFAGGFRFPNLEYDHARLFLMNLDLQEMEMYADYDVYRDGLYANTKIGNGILLDTDVLKEISTVFRNGADELISGLGKCYFPRHGIIYYDKLGTPLASLSICFECDRISMWSIYPLSFKGPDMAKDWDKAEHQMEELRIIFVNHDLPYLRNPEEYKGYADQMDRYICQGDVSIYKPDIDSLFMNLTTEAIFNWVHKLARRFELKTDTEIKITDGGDEYSYLVLKDERGTKLYFSPEEDGDHLAGGLINNSAIILPNGISVGMSCDDVIARIGVYDGPSNPEHITIQGEQILLDFYFKYRTLVEIEIRI